MLYIIYCLIIIRFAPTFILSLVISLKRSQSNKKNTLKMAIVFSLSILSLVFIYLAFLTNISAYIISLTMLIINFVLSIIFSILIIKEK